MKDWYTEKRVSRSIFGSILEYEYLYLNGELDIDCIYLKKRREHIGTYKVADMEALFPLDAKRFREYRKDKNIKIRDCSAGRRSAASLRSATISAQAAYPLPSVSWLTV